MDNTGSLGAMQTLAVAGAHLNRHLMGLHVSVASAAAGAQHCVYSGFLLEYRQLALWITAGHVLAEIERIRTDSSIKVIGSDWLDGFDIENAETRPVPLESILSFRIDRGSLDLGFVILRPYDVDHIIASGTKEFLTERDLAATSDLLPPTMYLIGMPHTVLRVQTSPKATGFTQYDFWTHPVCVACRPVADRAEEGGTFWSQKNCFYLRAEPVLGNDGQPILDLHGMSGGPVFGIFPSIGGALQYTLYGIQSACSDSDSLSLRATDVKLLAGAIDVVMRVVQEKHGVAFPRRRAG